MTNELVKENQAQRRTITRLEGQLVEAGRVIRAADDLHHAAQGIPQRGSPANEKLAQAGEAYEAAKAEARKGQEGE